MKRYDTDYTVVHSLRLANILVSKGHWIRRIIDEGTDGKYKVCCFDNLPEIDEIIKQYQRQ